MRIGYYTPLSYGACGYRAQLVQPYLVDREMDDRLAKEAYDRLKENVEVSHILFRVNRE